MSDHVSSVLVVRDDGVVEVPRAVYVAPGLVETVERIFEALGMPAWGEWERSRGEEGDA